MSYNMSSYCCLYSDIECNECKNPSVKITGFMTKKDLEFAKENRERIKRQQILDQENEVKKNLKWEEMQTERAAKELAPLRTPTVEFVDTHRNKMYKYFKKYES